MVKKENGIIKLAVKSVELQFQQVKDGLVKKMNSKDYRAIAEIMNNYRDIGGTTTRIAEKLADYFEKEDPPFYEYPKGIKSIVLGFDKEQFLEQAGCND